MQGKIKTGMKMSVGSFGLIPNELSVYHHHQMNYQLVTKQGEESFCRRFFVFCRRNTSYRKFFLIFSLLDIYQDLGLNGIDGWLEVLKLNERVTN